MAYFTTEQMCEILDCSRPFLWKNFRDLGQRFIDIKPSLRHEILQNCNSGKPIKSKRATDVFYPEKDVIDRIIANAHATIQTDFLDLKTLFMADGDASKFMDFVSKVRGSYRTPQLNSPVILEGERFLRDHVINDTIRMGVYFDNLAILNVKKRSELPRIDFKLLKEPDNEFLHAFRLKKLYSARRMMAFYEVKTTEMVQRIVVKNAIIRVQFGGRTWYMHRPKPYGLYSIIVPAIVKRRIELNIQEFISVREKKLKAIIKKKRKDN